MSMATREATNDYVAQELRAELGRKRLSMSEVARRLDVEQTWLYKRLTGQIPLRIGEVFEIADAVELPLERIIDIAKTARETAGRVGSRINYFSFPSRLFRNLPAWAFSLRTA